jgi:hypothetical protein
VKRFLSICYLLLITSIAGADALSTTSMQLNGMVLPKSLFDLTGIFETVPDAVRLDVGDILPEAGHPGVEVGTWSVSSNSSSSVLILQLDFPEAYSDTYNGDGIGTFNATIEGVDYRVPYRISNGTEWVYDGDEFARIYKQSGSALFSDSGSVFLQRLDADSFPPYNAYETAIQLVLVAQ